MTDNVVKLTDDTKERLKIALAVISKCCGYDYSPAEKSILIAEAARKLGVHPTVTPMVDGGHDGKG